MLSKEFYLDIYDRDYVSNYNASINEVDLNMAITENELQKKHGLISKGRYWVLSVIYRILNFIYPYLK